MIKETPKESRKSGNQANQGSDNLAHGIDLPP
jgi:hypothetical protein